MTDEGGGDRGGASASKLLVAIGVVLGLIPLVLVIVADLDLESQAIFAGVCLLLLLVLSRLEGRDVTLVLVILSTQVSRPHIWVRFPGIGGAAYRDKRCI